MKDAIIKIFAVLVLLFAYIITSRTPMMWEDVVYTLKADATLGAAMSNSAVADTIHLGRYERVKNVSDLVESSYHHYMNANGRLFPHMTSQAFGALIGKSVFNVLNAIMFVLLISVVTLLVVRQQRDYWKWWIVVLSGLWLLMPETNTCFFLMTYALNYLWSSAFCVLFLLLYFRLEKQQIPSWALATGSIFAFGAGLSHEGIAVGIAAALVFDNGFDIYYHQLNRQKLIWGLCFCFGASWLCLAPGNFTRTDAALPLYNHLLSFARLRLFWLFLICWCLFSRSIDFIRENRFLIIALFFQATFMFFVGFRNGRVLWGTEFFSLILLLKLFTAKEVKGYSLSFLSYFMLALLFVHFSWLVYRSGEVRKQYDEIIALYLQSPDGIVYYDAHREPFMVSKYIPTPLCSDRPFERLTISVYHTKDAKHLSICPTAMKPHNNE